MRAARVLLVGFAAACSGSTSAGDAPRDPPETHERFVGEWMVNQPFHATYEASWYLFRDDGELAHLRDCSLGGTIPTGWVTDAGGRVRCEFATRWSAADAATLVIEGACNDGRDRDIVLGFPTDTSANATGLPAIEIVAVGGEDGWLHAGFDWNWQKCGEDSCDPAVTDVECPWTAGSTKHFRRVADLWSALGVIALSSREIRRGARPPAAVATAAGAGGA